MKKTKLVLFSIAIGSLLGFATGCSEEPTSTAPTPMTNRPARSKETNAPASTNGAAAKTNAPAPTNAAPK